MAHSIKKTLSQEAMYTQKIRQFSQMRFLDILREYLKYLSLFPYSMHTYFLNNILLAFTRKRRSYPTKRKSIESVDLPIEDPGIPSKRVFLLKIRRMSFRRSADLFVKNPNMSSKFSERRSIDRFPTRRPRDLFKEDLQII